MAAKTKQNTLGFAFHETRQSHHAANTKVSSEIQCPDLAAVGAILLDQIRDPAIAEPAQVNARPLQAVVPPDGNGISLHHLQQTLKNRFLQGVTRGVAVGASHGDPRLI